MITKEVTTFRIAATGVWGYEFYDQNRQRIGHVSSIVDPSVPVQIQSQNYHWYSHFDIDTTIIPGIGRRVLSNPSGEEVYRLIYWRPDLYQVHAGDQSVQVEISAGRYLFGQQGMPVTAMTERIESTDWMPVSNLDCQASFRTIFYEDVNEALALMILSFPTLRFY